MQIMAGFVLISLLQAVVVAVVEPPLDQLQDVTINGLAMGSCCNTTARLPSGKTR